MRGPLQRTACRGGRPLLARATAPHICTRQPAAPPPTHTHIHTYTPTHTHTHTHTGSRLHRITAAPTTPYVAACHATTQQGGAPGTGHHDTKTRTHPSCGVRSHSGMKTLRQCGGSCATLSMWSPSECHFWAVLLPRLTMHEAERRMNPLPRIASTSGTHGALVVNSGRWSSAGTCPMTQ